MSTIYELGYDQYLSRTALNEYNFGEDYAGSVVDVSVGSYNGGLQNLTENVSSPQAITSGATSAITWFGKTTFSDTTAGYRWGVEEGEFKMKVGDASGGFDWNITTADTLTITGTIIAAAGTLGGFTIGATTISAANLTISSAVPSIALGSTTDYFTGTGFWVGLSGGAYKFHAGNPAGEFIKWDGSNLTVTGIIAASSGSSIASTATDTFTINSDLTDANIDLVFGRTTGGNATMRWNGTTVNLDKTLTIGGTGIVLTTRTITSGDGLTGGGDLSSDRTLAVGAGTLITVSADAVGVSAGAADYGFIGSTTTPWTATWLSISQFAGNGLTHATGALSVGAGTLITVGADTVGITDGANYQFIATGAGTSAAWTNVSVLAGAGLTAATGVLAVGAGNGITVNADDVALTTPGTLSVSSSNSSSGSHTHAVTSSSNPGAAASLLASDASGFLTLVKISTDTIADKSGGNLTISPAGDIVFDPTGNDILPNTGYDLNIGSLTKKYLTLHAAELWVETLVAQSTVATIGGRVMIGATTTLTRDLTAIATTLYSKHNEMASGDRVYFEVNGSVEFMAITSVGVLQAEGDYAYTITRNLDGSGANAWTAGDAIFNTGTTGDGFIDLYSFNGVKAASEVGPAIVGNVRNSATYNDWTSHWAIGNLNGLYGYGVTTWGAAFGEYAANKTHITIDSTNGYRIFNGVSSVLGQWDASGNISIGSTAAEHAYITSTAVQLKDGATVYAELSATALTLGLSTTEHILINSTSVQFLDNTTVYTNLTAGALTLGDSVNENVLIDTTGVSIRDGASVYAIYGATTTIGLATSEHLQLTATSVSFLDGASVYTDLTAGVLTLGLVSGGEYITIDGTNGIKLYGGAVENLSISNAGVITVGEVGASKSNILISSNAIYLRTNTTNKITLGTDGNASLTGNLSIGTAGAIYSGQTAYNTGTGWWWEYNAGTPRLSLGNPAASYLIYDGTNVETSGKVIAHGGSNVWATISLVGYFSAMDNTGYSTRAVSLNTSENANADLAIIGATSTSTIGRIARWKQLSSTATPAIAFYNSHTGGGTAFAGYDNIFGIIKIGSYFYASYWDSGSYLTRFNADITTPTTMTLSGGGYSGSLTWDNANSYLCVLTNTTQIRRYTISGTTATYNSLITLDTAVTSSTPTFMYDGTFYYAYDATNGLLRKFNSAGVQQTTLNIGETDANLFKGLVKIQGILYLVAESQEIMANNGYIKQQYILQLIPINDF